MNLARNPHLNNFSIPDSNLSGALQTLPLSDRGLRIDERSPMESSSRPTKGQPAPAPYYLTQGDSALYCQTCGRVIGKKILDLLLSENIDTKKKKKKSNVEKPITSRPKKSQRIQSLFQRSQILLRQMQAAQAERSPGQFRPTRRGCPARTPLRAFYGRTWRPRPPRQGPA